MIRVRVFITIILSLWVSGTFVILLSGVSENTFIFSQNLRFIQRAIIPQGWAFFTKDSREPRLYIYREDIGNKFTKISFSDNRNNPVLSFNRVDRVAGIIIGKILNSVPHFSHDSCDEGTQACLGKERIRFEVPSIEYNDFICGKFIFVLIKPLPWAWGGIANEEQMPGDYVSLNIKCDRSADL